MSVTRALRSTITQMTGKIIATLLGIVTLGIMTRYLGAEHYGWYTTAITYLQIVGILIDFGLTLVTGQMLGSGNAAEEKRVVHNLLAFRTITAFFAYVVAGSLIWFFPYNLETKLAVELGSIAFFFIALNQIFTGVFQKHFQGLWAGVAEVVLRAVLLIGVLGVVHGDRGFLALVGATVIAGACQTAVLAVRAHGLVPLGFAFDRAVWREIFKKCWPIAISIAFNLIYLRADVLILTLTRSQVEVGLYGAAYRIMDVTTAVPVIFMGLMLPLLSAAWSRRDVSEFGHLVERGFTIFSILAIPMLAGGTLLATPLMRLIAGAEFAASGPVVQILLVALMGGFLGALFGHTVVAINHQQKTIWIYVVTALLTLVGYLIFIPEYGMPGAAWMTVFSEVLAGSLLWWYVQRVTGARVPFMPALKAIFASLVMLAALYPLQHFPVLLLIVLGAIAYGLVMVAIKGVPWEAIKKLL